MSETLPALFGGVAAGLASATLFGATFPGIGTTALATGAHLQIPGAVALLPQHYIDSSEQNVADVLQQLGGAVGVIATAASGSFMGPLVAGLAPRGKLVVVGAAPDPIEVRTAELIFGTRTIQGHVTGTPIENEDNLAFSLANDIHPLVERFALPEAPKAYEHMLSGRARFRVVLDAAA